MTMISRRVALAALALVLCCALADAKKKKKDLAADFSKVCLPTENARVPMRRGAVTAPSCMTATPYSPAPVTNARRHRNRMCKTRMIPTRLILPTATTR